MTGNAARAMRKFCKRKGPRKFEGLGRAARSGDLAGRLRHIPVAGQQALNGNVLVQLIPVDAESAQFERLTLNGRGVEQAREPCQRDAQYTGVIEFDP